ncbi:MAG: CvpA family protein [Acidaminobacteraceae bacterium]
MFNWVDVVIAIILIYSLFRGFTEGFIRSVAGIIGYIISGLLAKMYYKSTAIYIAQEYMWFGDIKLSISKHIKSSFALNPNAGSIDSGKIDPEILNSLNLPSNLKGEVVNFFTEFTSMSTGGNAVDRFADYFSSFILNGIAFLLIFLVCIIAIKMLSILLDTFVKLPVLKQVNQLSGIIFGGIKGCLIVYLIMTIVIFTTPIVSNTRVIESIQLSTLGSFFYNYNIFLFIIDNIVAGDFKNLILG